MAVARTMHQEDAGTETAKREPAGPGHTGTRLREINP